MKAFLIPLIVFMIIALHQSAFAAETVQDNAYHPLDNLKGGVGLIFDEQNQWNWSGGALATLIANHYDHDTEIYFRGTRRLGDFDPIGNDILGTGVPGAILAGGLWLYGAKAHHEHEVQSGQAQLEALAVTGVVTTILKVTLRRQRPDSSDNHSFPSGHTSTMFATAATLNEFYSWKVSVPAYALAALTGLGRVSSGRHYISDVTAGATLGMVFGHAFGRFHRGKLGDHDVVILPVIDEDSGRILVTYHW